MHIKHKRVPLYYGVSGKLEAPDLYYRELVTEAQRLEIAPPVVINDMALENDPETTWALIDRIVQNRIIDERINSSPMCSMKINNLSLISSSIALTESRA